MYTLAVQYELAAGISPDSFEQWLQTVDLPGYAKLKHQRNPRYFRMQNPEQEGPITYLVLIETDSWAAVDAEMADPAWEDFIAQFEARTQHVRYLHGAELFREVRK